MSRSLNVKNDESPSAAAAAGCMDFVLPPANVAKELARMAKYPYVAGRKQEVSPNSASFEHVFK